MTSSTAHRGNTDKDRNALRKGWCPGALRPMMSGDGLIVRLRLPSNALSTQAGLLLSRLARQYGNGVFDGSQRANIQMRGVKEDALPALAAELSSAGLIDDDPAVEAVRNVIVSPLAGLDPAAADVGAMVTALDYELRHQSWMQALPGKFGFAIDAGGLMPLGETAADVTLRFATSGENQPGFVFLARCRDIAARVSHETAVSVLRGPAQVFLDAYKKRERRKDTENPPLSRMRDLVREIGAAAIFEHAGLRSTAVSLNDALPPAPGTHDISDDATATVVGLPFGSLDADQLEALSTTAAAVGSKTLRMTPWRSIVIPSPTPKSAQAILEVAEQQGLIVSPQDARLLIDACPGAPACAGGEAHIRNDAKKLAQSLAHDFTSGELTARSIHMSGCKKGCARRGAAPVTLIANNGTYDLVRDGSTSDTPYKTGVSAVDLPSCVASALGAHSAKTN